MTAIVFQHRKSSDHVLLNDFICDTLKSKYEMYFIKLLESAASRHCLAPPEGPGTRGTPGVNLRGQPRGSGGDSKAI